MNDAGLPNLRAITSKCCLTLSEQSYSLSRRAAYFDLKMDSDLDFNALLNEDLKSSFNNVTMSLLGGQEEEPPLPLVHSYARSGDR